jgi:hypothetical protein
MFFKNIEGYPGLVKEFPIDSKALSSRRGRILSLSQVLKCPWGGRAEFLSIDNSSERGYFSPHRRARKKSRQTNDVGQSGREISKPRSRSED